MEKEYTEKLDKILERIFADYRTQFKGQNLGVLFSAGVDSSLVAVLAEEHGLSPILYNFGTEFSKDRSFAENMANDLGLNMVAHDINTDEIENAIPFIKSELEKINIDPNWMQVALAVGVYFIGKRAAKDNTNIMLCGQGSDELFGGYSKFNGLKDSELQVAMENGIKSVIASDIKRDAHMLSLSGIALYSPYTDPEFIDYALSIPISYKIKGEIKKYIIREVAKNHGLPEYITTRPKNAMQYSSGIQKVIDKISKRLRNEKSV
jgi:asparagine synthase (glutamine-hydrolysing)